jgi:nuclear transport factor 2 (NTF2) superfamily protein
MKGNVKKKKKLGFRLQNTSWALFGNVVAVAFQSAFYSEIY